MIESRSNAMPTAVLGTVIAVTGSQMRVRLSDEPGADERNARAARIGGLVKVAEGESEIIGRVSSSQLEEITGRDVLVVDLVGEIAGGRFHRGVSRHPVSNAAAYATTEDDLRVIYNQPSLRDLRIGAVYDDPDQPAFVQIDDLLGKHFAVVGSTGSGKSCTVALILDSILNAHPNAHVLMLDPHNEYATAFGDKAELLNVDNLQLPLWMLDSEEAVRVLVVGGSSAERETQAMILRDTIARARRHYATDTSGGGSITVDTPVPYRVADLIRFLNESMGRLDKPDTSLPYLRLRTRIESLRADKRYGFMFSEGLDVPDTLADVLGRLMRIPVNGKPIAIMDLSGMPSEVTDVVVSLCCRLIFDFALWSKRESMPPMLIVCEEAQRYVPALQESGFDATQRVITRIAKEGRKYGLSLALLSQRPSELSPDALSQCGTIFALRMGSEVDQQFVARAVPDAAQAMLAALPSMPTQQALVSGEGVRLPVRIRMDELPAERRPQSSGAAFSSEWQEDRSSDVLREQGIRRWRLQAR
ncbi:MAG TPA: ATP-binding protein [Candidatus Baltobacteraceae bacterium]|nr:ATP-binding protein [Candidatus Baltobacteraceae bacterium]